MGPDNMSSASAGGGWWGEEGTDVSHHSEFWLFTCDPMWDNVLCTRLGRTSFAIQLGAPVSHRPPCRGQTGPQGYGRLFQSALFNGGEWKPTQCSLTEPSCRGSSLTLP